MQQTTMAFITMGFIDFIVSIDFFFGLILYEVYKWILLDEADALL